MTITEYVPPALADLESRAGASDADEVAWQEERLLGATATNVRDMWLLVQGGTSVEHAAEAIARKKLAKRWGSGPEARYGIEREKALAAFMQVRYGLRAESRVFHASSNSRYLASPDAVGVNFDEELVLGETKTGAERFFGYEHMVKKGYIAQQAWQMFVCEAVEDRGVFEERLGTRASGFEPGRQFEWVVRWLDVADMVRDELIPMADALIAALDRLVDAAADDIDRDIDSLAIDVLHARELEAEAKAAKESAWKALQALLAERGERVEQESTFARVLYTPEERGVEKVRVVDESNPEVVRAREAVAAARAELAVIEDTFSTVEEVPVVVKKAGLTVSDVQKRGKK
ncbi:hypothetical protein L332_03385 [Agrococcus pavilionensis RW1]|uniref:YqaJ viral recombinase domain-containing protein n=1 Tax=Agrococcus pavilionensis RW1 TaxID=1330458 RepID=U1L942_9MICO|nr:YqaJ viral recombinase family protein [Agrococcus pavilionensis]ERG63498.1 hypothetical protein L332_03385 [Agrococcus pavilionensis RW1]